MEEPRVMISGGCDLALNSKILLPLIFLSSRLPQTPPFFQAQLRSFLPSLREAAASQLYAKSSDLVPYSFTVSQGRLDIVHLALLSVY